MTIRLVDVSHHNGAISPATWKAWKARWGLTAAMVKVSEGMTFTDPQFAASLVGIRAAGLVAGGYHYADPSQSAVAQARRFVALMRPRPGEFVCMDLEQSGGLTQVELADWQHTFGDELSRLWPSTVAYMGGYSANGSGRDASLHFNFWMFPRYATTNPSTAWPSSTSPRLDGNTTGWRTPHIWQWTPALPPGIDASVSSLTAAELAAPPTSPGGDLTLSASQFDQIMAAIDAIPHDVMAYDQQGTRDQAWWYLQQAAAAFPSVQALTAALTPQAIAAAVVAALPPGNGGTAPTVDQIADAVAARLGQLLTPPASS